MFGINYGQAEQPNAVVRNGTETPNGPAFPEINFLVARGVLMERMASTGN
jgi:hypothetical protein